MPLYSLGGRFSVSQCGQLSDPMPYADDLSELSRHRQALEDLAAAEMVTHGRHLSCAE